MPITVKYYLVGCLDCDEATPLRMPFTTQAERGGWAARHREATGHDRFEVSDEEAEIRHWGDAE
jgi:hypothetical protein